MKSKASDLEQFMQKNEQYKSKKDDTSRFSIISNVINEKLSENVSDVISVCIEHIANTNYKTPLIVNFFRTSQTNDIKQNSTEENILNFFQVDLNFKCLRDIIQDELSLYYTPQIFYYQHVTSQYLEFENYSDIPHPIILRILNPNESIILFY